MNRQDFLRASAALLALPLAGAARAASERGVAGEAEALVKKAVAFMKANGNDKAFEEFTNGKSFKDRDLYIFVYDLSGKCVAHGANAKLVGKDLMGMKDPDGKPLIKMLVDVAKEKGSGWTDTVKFRNPISDKIQTRVNYIEKSGEYAVGSGIFKD
jgi:signal transduction histidine kinase